MEIKYLEEIVRPLLVNPEDLKVEKKIDERGILLTIFINPIDVGIIIGRSGGTIQAIRHIIRQYGMAHQARISVIINDPKKNW